MNVTRTNPSIGGMGCMWCGGSSDDFDSPAFGSCAAQSARDQAGIDFSAMGMPSQTQLLAASSDGSLMPLTAPASSSTVTSVIDQSVNQPGSMANALTQTAPDYPSPTALTVAQAFQGVVPGDAQPGYVPLPGLNWTANNLSFVQPQPGPAQTCPISNWANNNPLLLIAGVFAIAYLATSQKGRRSRAA